MAASVNRVTLIGHLGKDPETRYMQNGDAVTNITLATSDTWKDKNGDKQEKTEWHRITLYRKLAEIAGKYLHKGSNIYLEGRLETKKFTDKNGIEKYVTDIIANNFKMLDKKQSDQQPTQQGKSETGFDDIDDDLIPF